MICITIAVIAAMLGGSLSTVILAIVASGERRDGMVDRTLDGLHELTLPALARTDAETLGELDSLLRSWSHDCAQELARRTPTAATGNGVT